MKFQTSVLRSSLPLLFSLSGFLFLAGASIAADAPTVALKYAENGLWYVHVLKLDAEGYPDTIEKSGYATEEKAAERIRILTRSRGTLETRSFPEDEPTHELRNPLAGEIWTATNAWSLEWEAKYSEWIRTSFDKKFFKRHQIKTDCADAAVAPRWIFARMNGLPAGNRLSWGGGLLTNRSVRAEWKNLPTAANWYEDQRFMRALEYMMVNTYTHSINSDGYPIQISSEWLREGAFHLELRAEDGHTRLFTNISRKANSWPIEDMWSNVPRKVRKLAVESFTVYSQPPMKSGGILRHRWPRMTDGTISLVPAEKMPGYSLEQYLPEFFQHRTNDFSVEAAARLRDGLDPVIGMESVLDNLRAAIGERGRVVEEGYAVCSRADCSEGTGNYEDWSTPSRDTRIGQYFSQITDYLTHLQGEDLERANRLLDRYRKKKLLKFEGEKFRYDEIEAIWKAKKYSSDPRDPPAKRWGRI